jgi:DNA-binding NarL/FixJ family response regulator
MDIPKVLIVEDDVIVGEDLSRGLRASGYEVVGHAVNGDEAMDLTHAATPDVILMDVFLGAGMDGIAVARRIADCMDVPIVFITGCTTDSMIDAAVKAGADGFIVKPFQLRQVTAAIKVALEKRENGRRPATALTSEPLAPGRSNRVHALLSDGTVWTVGEPSLERFKAIPITRREKEIILGLASYRRLPKVAAELGISVHTARNHLKSIFQKLDVHSQDELLQCLMESNQE